jgi:DNA polymerase-4
MDARSIRRAAGECLKRVDLTRRLRLLGVRAGALARLSDLVGPAAAHEGVRPPRAEESATHYGLPLFDNPI